MKKAMTIGGIVAIAAAIVAGFVANEKRGESDAAWASIQRTCTDCHNREELTADIAFDTMTPESIATHADIFEKAVRKLRGRMMPPPGGPTLSEPEYDRLVAFLETTLDAAAAANPGHVRMRRLNRTEYGNAIEDLFDMPVDPRELLPKDDESTGFDNIADVLSESPSFVDQYVSAARVVATMATGDPDAKPETRAYYAVGQTNQSRHDAHMPLGTRGGIAAKHFFPVDGIYRFRVDGLVTGDYTPGLEYRHKVLILVDDEEVFAHDVGGDADMREVDQRLAPALAELNAPLEDIRVPVRAGWHDVAATFVGRSLVESDDWLYAFVPGGGDGRIMAPRRLEIAGPLSVSAVGDTPSRERIFVCTPASAAEEGPCAEEILGTIARRAFRRPVTAEDLETPLEFYRKGSAEGGFEAGIRSGIMAILVSPKFLYRAEAPPAGLEPGQTYRLDDFELASRLSFFLWSRLPDEELLALAEQGRLGDPEVLSAQVRRMLADERARSLVTNFAVQWLELRKLASFSGDPAVYPQFDRELRDSAENELLLFVQSVLLENRNVLELLTSDRTFVNERLALHYGLPNVQGDRFREVALDDPNRWGLLGKAAVLMITSYPNRTAPVLRGAWILDHLMGTPPAAPPANVEALPETVAGGPALTVRARLETHRKNPSCNGCHGIMDPLGFALENYDAVGQWRERDQDAGDAIDASGELADGTHVRSPRELSAALAAKPDWLAQTLTETLMMYALGRRIEYFDMPAIRDIVRTAARDDYRFFAIVEGIVASDAFQYQRVEQEDADVHL